MPKFVVLVFAVFLLATGCAGETAPTDALPPTPTDDSPSSGAVSPSDPSPTFQPGQREYFFTFTKDGLSDTLVKRGGLPPVTDEEFETTCVIFRRNDWDLPSFFADPEATERLSSIAGALDGGLKALEDLNEKKGVAGYTLVHFCDDAESLRGQMDTRTAPQVARMDPLAAAADFPQVPEMYQLPDLVRIRLLTGSGQYGPLDASGRDSQCTHNLHQAGVTGGGLMTS